MVEKYDEKNARAHIKRVKDILGTPQLLSTTPVPAPIVAPAEEGKEGGDEKLKKNYEEFMAIVERESKKEIPMPPQKSAASNVSLIRELFESTPSIEQEMNKVQHIKCVESISFSAFNPVPPHRRLVGDLFYLVIRTLEGADHGLTCSVNGFYRNDNLEGSHFSPGPSRHPCSSYTLVGCLH